MAKTGRKQKPYQTSWGEIIPGLNRQVDGRWRIVATGVRFSETDEAKAVARFKQLTQAEPVMIPVAPVDAQDGAAMVGTALGPVEYGVGVNAAGDEVRVLRAVPGNEIWKWLREELATRPEYVARMVGIPELAGLRYLAIPKNGMKLSAIIDNYRKLNPSTNKAKSEAVKPLERLIKFAHAKTLDDLTEDKFAAFKQEIENDPKLTSAGTRRGYYGRIKSIIGFGLKTGMDPQQIRLALDRAKVLWTSEPMPSVQPTPIKREHFHKLLEAGNGSWRPWLLLGLNLCLHLGEVCALQWKDFDLDKGIYAAIRGKTRRQRIPRAAVLWDETIEAMKTIKRTDGPYVFTSTHKTKYNRNTRGREFGELRKAAGVPVEVTFDCIRDGAYTAACHGTTDERHARVLAGHKAAGLQDNYVLRNPEIVKPACAAVYKSYFGQA